MLETVAPSSLAVQARRALHTQPHLPLPGAGQTLQRWRALAAMGAQDLCVAKVLEAHHDARAILSELAAPLPAADTLLAVWAAEGPGSTLRADIQHRLSGDKPWCSGASEVDAALLTVRSAEGCQLYLLQIEHGSADVAPAEAWVAPGMARIPSTTVTFRAAQAQPVGSADAYLQRPGFWHGGAGIAAVWFGAAAALAERMRASAHGDVRARLLGRADLALAPAAALLRELAAAIDAQPTVAHREAVVRVRSVVERAATQVLDLAGRALGPAPMCLEAEHARRWADLTVFLRQSHADKDWAWLGEQAAAGEGAWAL